MPSFVATVVYELDPLSPPDARKLLRAELAGRRYADRYEGNLLPAGTVWIRRTSDDGETVDDLLKKCRSELEDAVEAVRRSGRKIELVRAWIQIAGAGAWGLVVPDRALGE